MSADESELRTDRPRRFRPRFSLLTLLLLVTAVSVALFVARRTIWNHGAEASVQFRIHRVPPTMLGDPRFDPDEFDHVRLTQAELIKGESLLIGALRQPGIAGLPILAGRKDPVDWLLQQLEVESTSDSEIMTVRLRGAANQANDLGSILNAVASAYQNSVLDAKRMQKVQEIDELRRVSADLEDRTRRSMTTMTKLDSDSSTAAAKSPGHPLMKMEVDVLTEQCRELRKRLEVLTIELSTGSRVESLGPARIRTW